VGGASVLALMCTSAVVYMVVQQREQKRKAHELFFFKTKMRSTLYNKEYIPPLMRKYPRKVKLYFDVNDKLVDEDTALNDENNYHHKYHTVEVDFGNIDGQEHSSNGAFNL
jgi:hypothetical protein